MNTCRFCKLTDYDKGPGPLIQYGVRHYAHGPCIAKRKGVAAVAALPRWMLEHQLPLGHMRRAGVDVVALMAARDAICGDMENAGRLGADTAKAVAREYLMRVSA